MQSDSYEERLSREKAVYRNCIEVHELPAAFHYWSNRFLRPKLNAFGFDSPNELFFHYLEEQCARSNQHAHFVSLGSGNCDLEIAAALALREKGFDQFTLECCELNEIMLDRGRSAANRADLGSHLAFTQLDLNYWKPARAYDAVLANQSLHHLANLENVFSGIAESLKPRGSLVMSDMIGRNGHQRWPEALSIVKEFWSELPPSYRFNTVLNRYEEMFQDWDCSGESFEGIRSQDILPLLVDRFHFRFFLGFGNVIDPFVDRAFGPHFNRLTDWDRAFLERVHARDEQELTSGRIKPTHMLAVAGMDPDITGVFDGYRSPRFSIRTPHLSDEEMQEKPGPDPYDVRAWPADLSGEVLLAIEAWKESEELIRVLKTALAKQDRLLEERTVWARQLEREMEERTAWAKRLDSRVEEIEKLIEERTAWAQSLDRELAERTRHLSEEMERLDQDLAERTRWAQRLDRELTDRTRWALDLRRELEDQKTRTAILESEIQGYLRNPLRFAMRLLKDIGKRLRH